MPPGRYQGCGRGVFALSNWNIPLKRPQALLQASKTASGNDWKVGQKLMMKYSHKPQPNSPLEKELAVKQLENVTFVSRFDENWIVVRSEAGEEGYVPDKYVMASQDETVKNLPWLDSTAKDQHVQQEAVQWKPYKSAYAPKERETTATEDEENYYCKVCEKKFNGPIPYNVHLNSKAHKEELELLNDDS